MFESFERQDRSLVIRDTDFTEVVNYERFVYPPLERTFLEIINAYKKRGLNYHRAFGDAMYFNYDAKVHRSTIWIHAKAINRILNQEMLTVSDMRCVRRCLKSKGKYYSDKSQPESAVIDED